MMNGSAPALVISFPIELRTPSFKGKPIFYSELHAYVRRSNGLVKELQLIDRLLHTQHSTHQQWATGQEAAAESL
jgi:hypothetical protein